MPKPLDEKLLIAGGKVLFKNGEYEQAISYFKKCLGVAGATDWDMVEIYRQLSLVYWYDDKNEAAIECYQKAIFYASELGLQRDVSLIKDEITLLKIYAKAIDLRNSGDLIGSNLNFERALNKSVSTGSQFHELKVLRTWSSNYLGTPGALKRFRELNVQALKLALTLNHRIEASGSACNIGTYYAVNSDYSNALSYYLRSLYYIKDLPPNNDTIASLNNIAVAYISLGDFDKANDYVMEALKLIIPGKADFFQASPLINLGQIYRLLARTSGASDYGKRALECFRAYLVLNKTRGGEDLSLDALSGIASIYLDQGQLDQAREILIPAYEKVKLNKSLPIACMILLNLAEISFRIDKISESTRYYREALAAATQDGNLLAMIRGATGLGRCFEKSKDYRQAVAYYNQAIGIISDSGARIVNDISRAEFIFRSQEPYQALIELYFKMFSESRIEAFGHEIYRVSEMFRARSLIEFMERERQLGNREKLESGRLQDRRLNNERLNLLRELLQPAQKKEKYGELQSKIEHIDDFLDTALFDKYLQSFESVFYCPPVSLGIVQSFLLTDRIALVEYFLGDERSYIFCITKKEFHFIELPSAQSIYDSLIAYLSFLEDPTIRASKGLPAARRLYGDLLLPVEKFIPDSVDHLIIVPDGILFRLPFESLALQPDSSSPVRYLNDRFVISYAPSASALMYMKQKPIKLYTKDALAFGASENEQIGRPPITDEAFSAGSVLGDLYRRSGFNLAPLPHAQEEITGLVRRLRRDHIDVYFGTKATEKAFKRLDLEAYRLIHLACHALSDDQYPLRSSLVLSAAGDDEEDGFLQVSEMYNMRTNADLVVLSACQTGRGKIVRNEGILGLPRVIFYMGARSVLATLWPVDDKASATFMEYFYDAYYRGEGKANALRVAKKKMANSKYGHPYYWASYTLTGEF